MEILNLSIGGIPLIAWVLVFISLVVLVLFKYKQQKTEDFLNLVFKKALFNLSNNIIKSKYAINYRKPIVKKLGTIMAAMSVFGNIIIEDDENEDNNKIINCEYMIIELRNYTFLSIDIINFLLFPDKTKKTLLFILSKINDIDCIGNDNDYLIVDSKLVFTEIEGIYFITDSPDALTAYYDMLLNKASMYKEIKDNIITKMYNKKYLNLLESINIEKNG